MQSRGHIILINFAVNQSIEIEIYIGVMHCYMCVELTYTSGRENMQSLIKPPGAKLAQASAE